jgi:hypothetical protein
LRRLTSVFCAVIMESEQQAVKFGLTLKQLRDLMDLRGSEAVSKIEELGGTKELCKKLNTSPVEGKRKIIILFFFAAYSDMRIFVNLLKTSLSR